MKTASVALKNLLASADAIKLVQCDLYTFTLVDGTVARYTGGDFAITIGPTTWSLGPTFKRGKTSSRVGLQVDTLEVTVWAKTTDLIAGVPWLSAFPQGVFDGARVLVERFISTAWTDTSYGKIYQFGGRLSKIDPADRSGAQFTVKSDKALLNIGIPHNLYQSTCMHSVYNPGCTLSRAAFTVVGTAATGSTASAVRSNLTQANDYFNLGVIAFTSGALSGQRRTIRDFANSNGLVTPMTPFSAAPANGDTFTIYPGCNKVYDEDCSSAKFNNQANFKATPFIPISETAYM